MDAIGLSGDKLDIVLMQLVRLMKDGQPYKMSKRTGKAITLTDLLEEIPIDAARFFFNMREPNSTLDFDLDLAVEETNQNPVYYVQYAHARICSISKTWPPKALPPGPSPRRNWTGLPPRRSGSSSARSPRCRTRSSLPPTTTTRPA